MATLRNARKVHRVFVALLLVTSSIGSSSPLAAAQRSVRVAAEPQRGLLGDTTHFEMVGMPTDTTEVFAASEFDPSTSAPEDTPAPITDAVVDSANVALDLQAEATTLVLEAAVLETAAVTENQADTPAPISSSPSSSGSGSSSSGATTELANAESTLDAAQVDSLKTSTTGTSRTPAPKKTQAPTPQSGSGSGSDSDSGSGSGSGRSSKSRNYEFGSGSTKSYMCWCEDTHRVSLMGRSDYCLPVTASVNDKCGNVNLGTKGECPRQGAQPCSPEIGYNLTKDSVCLLDEDANVFKCVASAEDFAMLRSYGKKGSRTAKQTNATGAAAATAAPTSAAATPAAPALHVVTLVATLALAAATLL